jgi:hypothetical protein
VLERGRDFAERLGCGHRHAASMPSRWRAPKVGADPVRASSKRHTIPFDTGITSIATRAGMAPADSSQV